MSQITNMHSPLQVGVAPSHQRKNIGTILVSKLFNLFLEEDIKLIIADTPQENTPAIRFLERMGFATPVSHVSKKGSTHRGILRISITAWFILT